MPSVIMLSVTIKSIMLNVVMLNVIMLNVVAACGCCKSLVQTKKKKCFQSEKQTMMGGAVGVHCSLEV
jgi:hypothetical protein